LGVKDVAPDSRYRVWRLQREQTMCWTVDVLNFLLEDMWGGTYGLDPEPLHLPLGFGIPTSSCGNIHPRSFPSLNMRLGVAQILGGPRMGSKVRRGRDSPCKLRNCSVSHYQLARQALARFMRSECVFRSASWQTNSPQL
jgi:hypothetical protein